MIFWPKSPRKINIAFSQDLTIPHLASFLFATMINIDIVSSLVVSKSCQVKRLKVTEKSISIKGLNVNRIIQVQIIQGAV